MQCLQITQTQPFERWNSLEDGWISINVYMGVSKNRGTPKSSILIGFSIINDPFWGTTIFGNTHIYIYMFTFFDFMQAWWYFLFSITSPRAAWIRGMRVAAMKKAGWHKTLWILPNHIAWCLGIHTLSDSSNEFASPNNNSTYSTIFFWQS